MATGRAAPPDLDACRRRAFVDPHPVVSSDDLRVLIGRRP
jgi:hypothetical protein